MPFCATCGKQNADTAKFCIGCGSKVAIKPPPAALPVTLYQQTSAPAIAICPHCGKENPPLAKFCGGCGNTFIAGATAMENKVLASTTDSCNNCGHPNKTGAKFCKKCGAEIVKMEKSPINTNKEEIREEVIVKDDVIKTTENKNPTEEVLPSFSQQENFIKAEIEEKIVELPVELPEAVPAAVSNQEAETNDLQKEEEPAIIQKENQLPEKITYEPFKNLSEDVPKIFEGNNNPLQEPTQKLEQPNSIAPLSNLEESISKSEVVINKQLVTNQENKNETIQEEAMSPEELDEVFNQDRKRRHKKTFLWTTTVLVLLAGGATAGYFFLGFAGNKNEMKVNADSLILSDKKIRDTIQPSPDSSKEIKEIVEPVADTQQINTSNKIPPAEIIPNIPPKAQILQDLAGIRLCNAAEVTVATSFLYFTNTQKNSRQCNMTFSFKTPGGSDQYIVTAVYKNSNGRFVYTSHTCTVKPLAVAKEKPLAVVKEKPVAVTATKHDVSAGLMNYLSGRKSFGGIPYNGVDEISITSIGPPQQYSETGNTGYTVRIIINGQERKCQVIYNASGGIHVNLLK